MAETLDRCHSQQRIGTCCNGRASSGSTATVRFTARSYSEQSSSGRKSPRAIVSLFFSMIIIVVSSSTEAAEIYGFRVEKQTPESGWSEVRDSRAIVYADQDTTIRIFGRDLSPSTKISFATKPLDRGQPCDDLRATEAFNVTTDTTHPTDSGVFTVNLRLLRYSKSSYFFCLKEENSTDGETASFFVHQGSSEWLQMGTEVAPAAHYMLPVWLMIIIIVLLLFCSGMFSGLNLGLMSLDKNELEIMIKSGTPKEKKYAKAIQPIRKDGNFLLCTILIGNVLINNTMAILLEDLTGSGFVAVLGATIAIVIFGEIVPQAICTRYALAVGARTVWFTKLFMFITFPVSYPISRILDCVLGDEIVHVYNRDRLRELIHSTENQTDLRKEEVNIITGALELSQKTVIDIMTRLEDVFMIEIGSILDFQTMNTIMKNGYSRVPVYERNSKNIVGLLNIKDLAFVDPDDRMPLKTVLRFYSHPVVFVRDDTPLDVMLQDFKKGHSHLAVVQKVTKEGLGDDCYEPVGLVTLEDVIEEIIQAEIVDETDIITDNRRRLPRNGLNKDFSAFVESEIDNCPQMSAQLALAAFQFLSASVPPFHSDFISEPVLQKVLRQNVLVNILLSTADPSIYTAGKPSDVFTMILQGRIEVEFAKDGIRFEGGPFTYFGIQALQDLQPGSNSFQMNRSSSTLNINSRRQSLVGFVPDYSVRAVSDVQCLCISRAQYIAAVNATSLERRPKSPQTTTISSNSGSSSRSNSIIIIGGSEENLQKINGINHWQRTRTTVNRDQSFSSADETTSRRLVANEATTALSNNNKTTKRNNTKFFEPINNSIVSSSVGFLPAALLDSIRNGK